MNICYKTFLPKGVLYRKGKGKVHDLYYVMVTYSMPVVRIRLSAKGMGSLIHGTARELRECRYIVTRWRLIFGAYTIEAVPYPMRIVPNSLNPLFAGCVTDKDT